MKKALLLLLITALLQIPVYSAPKKFIPQNSGGKDDLPNIFIYSIPDDEPEAAADENKEQSDDETYITPAENTDEEIVLIPEEDNVTLGATVLKGYAEYLEDSNVVYLKDDNDEYVLNLKVPQKITGEKGLNLTKTQGKNAIKYTDAEYLIAPQSITTSTTTGNFTFGAVYNNEVDNIAMLESETGLFTKYEKSKFALSSSVTKSLNTTYSEDYNTISITPELKLNSYISLKNKLQADVTRNRRSSELVFSLNPFGKKDSDKMRLEAGAKQTYYADTGENKTQLNFSATFKL